MWINISDRVTLLILASSLPLTMFAHQNTIPERVAVSNGKPVVMMSVRDLKPVSLADLVAGADLIVHGKLVRKGSYMAESKKEIYTDYALNAERVIVERGGSVTAKLQGLSVIVTLYGGELVVDGTLVKFEAQNPQELE
jgi:hypothetical protein